MTMAPQYCKVAAAQPGRGFSEPPRAAHKYMPCLSAAQVGCLTVSQSAKYALVVSISHVRNAFSNIGGMAAIPVVLTAACYYVSRQYRSSGVSAVPDAGRLEDEVRSAHAEARQLREAHSRCTADHEVHLLVSADCHLQVPRV